MVKFLRTAINRDMKYIRRIIYLILHRKAEFCVLLLEKFGGLIGDITYTKIIYRLKMGRPLCLDNPKTFNEKLQWLKLYDHNPLYTKLVDKYAVKDYVSSKIGQKYIIPTIATFNHPEEIDWDILPDKFVLKTTQGGGGDGVVVCKDKNSLDKSQVIKRLKLAMKTDPYKRLREWPYKNVQRRIIAEEYIADSSGELLDYKFFCFNGVVKALFVATDRSSQNVKFDYFDADFNHLDLTQEHPMSGKIIPKPDSFEEMKLIAAKLSEGLPQVRCDLYSVDGKVYFGELTFVHHGGVTRFHPDIWDLTWGDWITLPKEIKQ